MLRESGKSVASPVFLTVSKARKLSCQPDFVEGRWIAVMITMYIPLPANVTDKCPQVE